MAEPQDMEIPPAQLARTLAHMNKDHRLDLQHILQHYNSLPESEAALPEMLDLDRASMTVRVPGTGKQHAIKLDPQLEKWEDRRAVLVGMTHKAREALGVPPAGDDDGNGHGHGNGHGKGNGKEDTKKIVVNEYMPPRPLDWIIFWAVLGYYIIWVFVKLGLLDRGSVVAGILDRLLGFVPLGVGSQGIKWLTETIFLMVVAIHVVEVLVMERTRLRKFGVRRGTRVWWLWVLSCFVEGGMSFKRFDIIVERLRKEGKKE
ncbi:hypothetical protein QBC42DRAFT_276543 [Cladorrhinum samala]|uniref:DUF2470 domain-containing protein n=1 Tax=Cladorrhinum samala TaxID=585594 RepID=A0AAV9HCJ1_9PEZI|nr:hypothetical protein QBC42DRAFT_276543 [Cladorrhinum samala]